MSSGLANRSQAAGSLRAWPPRSLAALSQGSEQEGGAGHRSIVPTVPSHELGITEYCKTVSVPRLDRHHAYGSPGPRVYKPPI